MLSQPLPRLILLYMLSRNHKIRESHGPLQSTGICLLDLPFHSHLKPIASTSSAMALPHVATVPGPVSLPGALIVCTRLPCGVIGPVNASAFATTLPGISALQLDRSSETSNLIGAYSVPLTSCSFGNSAIKPPALPLKIICKASLCWELASKNRNRPTLAFTLPVQILPLKYLMLTRSNRQAVFDH